MLIFSLTGNRIQCSPVFPYKGVLKLSIIIIHTIPELVNSFLGIVYFFQVLTANKRSIGKISNRPANISKTNTSLEDAE